MTYAAELQNQWSGVRILPLLPNSHKIGVLTDPISFIAVFTNPSNLLYVSLPSTNKGKVFAGRYRLELLRRSSSGDESQTQILAEIESKPYVVPSGNKKLFSLSALTGAPHNQTSPPR